MSLPTRARTIVIDGCAYRWIVSRESARFVVRVQHASGRGARLEVHVGRSYDVRATAHGSGVRRRQTTRLGPDFVRAAMADARARGWDGTRPGADFVSTQYEPQAARERFANARPLRLATVGLGCTPRVADADRASFVVIDDLEIGCEVASDGRWFCAYLRSASRGRLASFLVGAGTRDELAATTGPPCGSPDAPWYVLEQGWQLVIWREADRVYVAEGGDVAYGAVFGSCFCVDARAYDARWRELVAAVRDEGTALKPPARRTVARRG